MRIVITGILFCISLIAGAQDSLISSQQQSYKSLTQLCDTFLTDKCPGKHGFIEIYEPIFTPMRTDSIRFFEIGILNGLSHLMWHEFFPNADVFGIDLRDYSKESEGSGIMTFVADQADRDDLASFVDASGGQFDVILDDGGHAMDHQQISLGYLFQHIKPGGMFIIEDVHTSLPYFYPDSSFKVNQDGSNSTLFMLENYIRTGLIESTYLSARENVFLQNNIDRIELHYMNNRRHSIVCIIHKKEEED